MSLLKQGIAIKISLITLKRNLIPCLLLLFSFSRINSQSYNFTTYNSEDGLPYIQIYALFQDNNGYLWSGGYGGLSRYDGKEFKMFNPKQGLSNNWVTCINEDKNAKLWIGTIDGLTTYDGNSFKTFYTKDNLCSDYINNIFNDKKGKIWIATTNGINYVEDGLLKKLEASQKCDVNCVYIDSEESIWAGTKKGLMKYSRNGKLLSFWNNMDDNEFKSVNVITQDNLGKMWVGTDNGLLTMNKDFSQKKMFTNLTNSQNTMVTSLMIDNKKNIWIGTTTGLIKYNGVEFSSIKLNDELTSNKISALFLDYEENIWVGSFNGLYKLRADPVVNYGIKNGLTHPFFYQVTGDSLGNQWFCSEGGGIYFYDGLIFKNYSTKDGLASNNVNTCVALNDGSMLFGTDVGYSIFKNRKFKNITNKDGFKLLSVTNFFKDSKDRIWAGSTNGLAYLTITPDKKTEYTYFSLPTNIKDYNVWSFAEDSIGNIWIGSYLAGLYKYDGKTIKEINCNTDKKTTRKQQSVLDITIKDGKYFFGATLGGILFIDIKTEVKKIISTENGLNSDLCYSLLLTKNGKTLWAGTNQGVNKINIDYYLKTDKVELVSFGKAEGFKGVECNSHGLYEDNKGNVWIGTVNGLSKFSPSNYSPNLIASKLNLTNIKLFYNDTLLANNAELPYNFNNISFNFKGMCFTNSSKVKYICKLEGFDKIWSPETNDNFKTYSNLPPGKYIFKVRSCNNEKIWNKDLIAYSFKILSPWYKSWWFILSLIAFTITIILVVFRIRLNQEKRTQKKELSIQIEFSKNELKALRAQINPHFIFNSLNSIQHFIIDNDNEEAMRYLNKFAKLFRMILNNSEKSTVTIREEINMLTIYLELESMRFQNKFEYIFIIDEKIDLDYEEMPAMLMQPYVENAILHGLTPKKEKGNLIIKIKLSEKFLICSIEDNGIGRKLSSEIKTSQKTFENHRSLGMKITQDRLALLNSANNSELSVNITDLFNDKGEAEGTKVDIYIPIT